MKTWTFLFTDIEGSTILYDRAQEVFPEASARHFEVLHRVIKAHGGEVFRETGDGLYAAFEQTGQAVSAAAECQRQLRTTGWPEATGELRVRMGLHRGEAVQGKGDFHGLTMHVAARVLDAAHGRQILCSADVASDLAEPQRTALTDLGLYRLRGFTAPTRLFQVAYDGIPAAPFPPARTPAAFTHTLPAVATRFFGRSAELHDLAGLLQPEPPSPRRHGRLVTLLGPGGTGKTRLSLAVAELLLNAYSHAVWFVPLAAVSDGALLADVLRDELRIAHEPGRQPLDEVAEMLGSQPSLLILDNFEQLVPTGVETVRQLLERSPDLVCLVSSRVRLDLRAEQEFSVTPLRLPPELGTIEELMRYGSVQLFIDRAQSARRSFQLTPENAADVAKLCRGLEGIPLAIELAAARAAVLTPRQILQRLEQRLDLLSGGPRDMPERHRSLRAAIAWSYELLPAPLRCVFARLSMFRGGWTLEAAERIAADEGGAALDQVSELRACSLVVAHETPRGMRYAMLEVLREYAAERLLIDGGGPEAAARFHAFFFSLAAVEDPPDQAAHFADLAEEYDNIRAMLGSAGPVAERLRAAVRLYPFWMIRGRLREGREWLRRLSEEARNVPDAPLPAAANAAGVLAWKSADYPAADEYFTAALRHWENTGHDRNIAGLLNNLALVANDRGDLETEEGYLQRALEIYRRGEHSPELAAVLNNLGERALRRNDLDDAQRYIAESLEVARRCAAQSEVANALHNLSEILSERGDAPLARRHFAECLDLRAQLRSEDLRVHSFSTLATMALRERRLRTAAMLLSAASHALEHGEEVPSLDIRAEISGHVENLRTLLAPPEFSAAWALGPAVCPEKVLSHDGEWLADLEPASAGDAECVAR